ncbi:unnamed protein product, partial [Cuscuta epithymum]
MGGLTDKDEVSACLHDAVYDSQTGAQFEFTWSSMLQRFHLNDHEWLHVLYNERHRWVPCYLRPTFWAGMSTTQRSESINAFFDDFVHSKTSLKEFVDQYGRALKCKVEKEFQEDAKCLTKMLSCVSIYAMEHQLQQMYTLAKFKEFRTQMARKL